MLLGMAVQWMFKLMVQVLLTETISITSLQAQLGQRLDKILKGNRGFLKENFR